MCLRFAGALCHTRYRIPLVAVDIVTCSSIAVARYNLSQTLELTRTKPNDSHLQDNLSSLQALSGASPTTQMTTKYDRKNLGTFCKTSFVILFARHLHGRWLITRSVTCPSDRASLRHQISQSVWSPQTVQRCLQECCLPFLRLASFMSTLMYDTPVPVIPVSDPSVAQLCHPGQKYAGHY